jgi:N-acetylmuramoyl-L-alanine amidase
MRPTLVRRDDRFVPLRARMAIARAARADLFVSLHADADPSGRVQGLSVYTGSRRAPPASAHAAANILREARKSLPIHKHQVQRAGFAVLKSSDIPSVLVETGFISHPKGEKDLANPARQDQIARVLLQSIRRYFAAVPPVRAAERLADAGGPIRR